VIGIHSRVGASKEESMHVPLREFQAHWDELKKSDFVGEGPFAKKPVPGSGFLGMLVEDDLEKKGLRVTELWEKGPAENAGIKVGDLIVEVEGEKATQELLKNTLGQLGSGQKISIKWIGGEETKEKELKLGDRP
jgi:serine protease Do